MDEMTKQKTYSFPLDGLEEGVSHDLHESGLLVTAETISRILVEEALQDGGGLHAQRSRNANRLLKND
jgi:hypothetical protein